MRTVLPTQRRTLNPVTTNARMEFLDVIRGLAASVVFIQHSTEIISPRFRVWSNTYLNLGEVGVVAFFIVSGFIIPVSIERYNSIPKFWAGRFLRLWPMYWLSLIIALFLGHFGLYKISPVFFASPIKFAIGNATMIGEYLGVPVAVSAYWTLGVELAFYAICSLLFAIGYLRRERLWLAVSALGLLIGQFLYATLWHRSLPAGRIGLLVTAFFGTMLYRTQTDRLISRKALLALPLILGIFVVCFWIRFGLYPPYAPDEARPTTLCASTSWILAYLCFLAIYALRSRSFPRILKWLGRISYSVYLLHDIVIFVVPSTTSAPLYYALTVTITLGLSHCTYELVEKRIGEFQHRVLRPTIFRSESSA